MAKVSIHASITEDRVLTLVKEEMFGLESPGLCIACGADHPECEPDAERYECYECGERQAYGAAELMMRGWFHK